MRRMSSVLRTGFLGLAVVAVAIAAAGAADKVDTSKLKGIHLAEEYLQIPFASFSDGKIYDHLNMPKGTIECWVKLDNWFDRKVYSLFFWGRRHNVTSMSIAIRKAYAITFHIMDGHYKYIGRSVKLREIRGRKRSSWHHFAFCWDLDDGKTDLLMFIDGRKMATKTHSNHPKRKFSAPPKFPTHLYIGAAKSGGELVTTNPPEFTVAQFRISGEARYSADFAPQLKLDCDPQTLAYFPFDAGEKGQFYVKGKAPGVIQAKLIKVTAAPKAK